MSVSKVRDHAIAAIVHRGPITVSDMDKILSRKDGLFSAPESLGSFIDKKEFAVLSTLRDDIVAGHLKAEPEAFEKLSAVVAKGSRSRLGHAAKWGLGMATSVGAAVVGGTMLWASGSGPDAMGALFFGAAAFLPTTGAAFVGGVLRGLLDD